MSWWVGIGLSAAVVTMTPTKSITPMTPMTVLPTIPPAVAVATVPAVLSPGAPGTLNTSGTPSDPPVSAGGDGDADVLRCDAALFDPNTELDAPVVERAIERTARTFQRSPLVAVVQPAELQQHEAEVGWRDQEVVTASERTVGQASGAWERESGHLRD